MSVLRRFASLNSKHSSFGRGTRLLNDEILNEILNQQRLKKTQCDVYIAVANRLFSAHRRVLVKRLKFFRDSCTIPRFSQTDNDDLVITIDIDDLELEVFEAVLEYIYISKIEITIENLEQICKVANYLSFQDLLVAAESFMMSLCKANIDHIVLFMNLAREYDMKSVEQECKRMLISNPLSDIGRRHLIPAISYKHLRVLLKRMKDRDEFEQMFELCIAWILLYRNFRDEHIPEMLQIIPLGQVSFHYLHNTIYKNRIVAENEQSRGLVIDALKNYRWETLFVIGGKDDKALSTVSMYDSQDRKWTSNVKSMPNPRFHFGSAVVGRKIYIAGGANEQTRSSDELTVYDCDADQWSSLRPMRCARQGCSMAALDGYLYVAGGDHNKHKLAVVERYCLENGRWEDVCHMGNRRNGLELVALNGQLYAIGGHNDDRRLATAEVYNPTTDRWRTLSPLSKPFAWFGSAVFNDHIYVTDGETFQQYSPDDDEWYELPPPSKSEGGTKLVVFDGKLLAVGGEVGGWLGMRKVEWFDFEQMGWIEREDMNTGRCYHQTAVVRRNLPCILFES